MPVARAPAQALTAIAHHCFLSVRQANTRFFQRAALDRICPVRVQIDGSSNPHRLPRIAADFCARLQSRTKVTW
jgi:hypothetical protein